MIIACDVDGVLADVKEYVAEYLPHDWKGYFARTSEFPQIKSMVDLVRSVIDAGSNRIYFITGRPESNRQLTRLWILGHVLAGLSVPLNDSHLLMRPDGDSRPNYEVKMEWIRKLRPDLIIDDDPRVVKAAMGEGFVVLQVHGFRATGRRTMIPTNYLEEGE